MHRRSFCLAVTLIVVQAALAQAEQPDAEEAILKRRLDNLESQAVQRQGREPGVLDLLKRQDDRIAGQALNTLKTKNPRGTAVPLFERKLDRSRRPLGSFGDR